MGVAGEDDTTVGWGGGESGVCDAADVGAAGNVVVATNPVAVVALPPSERVLHPVLRREIMRMKKTILGITEFVLSGWNRENFQGTVLIHEFCSLQVKVGT